MSWRSTGREKNPQFGAVRRSIIGLEPEGFPRQQSSRSFDSLSMRNNRHRHGPAFSVQSDSITRSFRGAITSNLSSNSDQTSGIFPDWEKSRRNVSSKFLETLLEENDVQIMIIKLSNETRGFAQLLDDKNLNSNTIVLLTKCLGRISESSFNNLKSDLLTRTLNSGFIERLMFYVTTLSTQNEREKNENKYFWDNTDEFWYSVINFSKSVQEILPTHCKTIEGLINGMNAFLPILEESHSLRISDQIKTETNNLKSIIKKTIEGLEVEMRKQKTVVQNADLVEPPDNFRYIEIVPNIHEIFTEKVPFLRANVIDGAFKDGDQYLDIQFRLLREDFIAPLRKGIKTYLHNQKTFNSQHIKVDEIRIYAPIRFRDRTWVGPAMCFIIQFYFENKKSKTRFEKNKFIFGSLVCFTSDNFKSLLFGKIVQCDIELLNKGQVMVELYRDFSINIDIAYVMVESTVLFEPYYHVLGVLQHIQTHEFPMKKYLIDTEMTPRPPKYLQQFECLEIEGTTVDFSRFPNNRFFNLNDSQLEAFKAALTEEFSVIQGPPGTGKTYLGLKIAEVLIKNSKLWNKKTPMLVICYTNHALDQFLEGLLPITTSIVRVGGQSKSEALDSFNLKQKKRYYVGLREALEDVSACQFQLRYNSDILNEILENKIVINFKVFAGVVPEFKNSWFSNAEDHEIWNWLLEGKNNWNDVYPLQVNQETEASNWVYGDRSKRYRCYVLVSIDGFQRKLKELNIILESLLQAPDTPQNQSERATIQNKIFDVQTDLNYLRRQLMFYQNEANRIPPLYVNLNNPFWMAGEDRWLLYYSWLRQYVHYIRESYNKSWRKYHGELSWYHELRQTYDAYIMRDHLVIGMTTTCAARLHTSLKKLRCPIVIVEEAAEVLEAHIVAALTKHCEHLILIGDHLQLKPGTSSYKLETDYNLGVSLFERMVRNNIECHTLNVQHRMRPEISRLIKPHIYPDLEDHQSTFERPSIFGVDAPLYFIDHQYREDVCDDISKTNLHETTFLVALARHLVLNGYQPEQITILAAYLGQMYAIKRETEKDLNQMVLKNVRISVLDNFQGEQSDIILLSLVRNNTENKAGFLRIQNRVCVALSRARNGLYIMGNMSMLLQSNSENKIWEKVNEVLLDQKAIGTHLTLRCPIHDTITKVSKSDDFMKLRDGGCHLYCKAPLNCGHVCKRLCHVLDKDHVQYLCYETCGKPLCDDPDHLCQKACFKKCGSCSHKVQRLLNCGHTVFIACSIIPKEYDCHVPIERTLPCGHVVDVQCSVNPGTFQCPVPCETRIEPCGHPCKLTCHVQTDPDHLEYKCEQMCAKPRRDCKNTTDPHMCKKLCCEECEECLVIVQKKRICGHVDDVLCKLEADASSCTKPCSKILDCGHICQNKCPDSCGRCKVKVDKLLEECGHMVYQIECHETPTASQCTANTCSRSLACGHTCKNTCSEPCTTVCKEMVDCHMSSPCGHIVKRIECHAKDTNDVVMLLKSCHEPCTAQLKCKHSCTGTCRTCFQGRIHVRCTEKCAILLVCDHECRISCGDSGNPCNEPCNIRCKHGKCNKKCGEPCTPCVARCERACPHVRCKKRCGAICEMDPCTIRCEKLLKCGHPCVGFCGDPCPPLCRMCDKDELTEIFFGTEDEEDAIFVYLSDCKHVVEHSGMEEWLKQDADAIQFKTCPKCKTSITTTERYSEYTKRAINDIAKVKEKIYGKEDELLRFRLMNKVKILKRSCEQNLFPVCSKLQEILDALDVRLEPSKIIKNNKRPPINKLQINAILSKYETISYILDTFNQSKVSFRSGSKSIEQLNMLLTILMRSEDHITNQEVDDLEAEIKRLHRIVQYEEIVQQCTAAAAETKELTSQVEKMLDAPQRYSESQDDFIRAALQELTEKVNLALVITDKERMEIVKALGLAKGHWFKCSNGHPYAIEECEGANKIAKCFCGAEIGGADHYLLSTNQFSG